MTVRGRGYNYYGASVDADGQGWCSVAAPGSGKIDITVTKNTGTLRTCYVNCWVANVQNPTESEKVILPVLVTQNPYKMEVTEATFERFNFETEAHTDLIWDYDGGGHMEFGEMVYWWHRDWDEMYVTHTHDTLTFWARQRRENAQISLGNKTGRLYFEYKNENMQVIEAYDLDHSETISHTYQERNHQYVGSTRDIGLVEVNFKLK